MTSFIQGTLKNLDAIISTGVVGYTTTTEPDPTTIVTAVGNNLANVALGRVSDVAGEVADIGVKSGGTALKESINTQINTAKLTAGKLLSKMGIEAGEKLTTEASSKLATTVVTDTSLGPIGIALIVIQLAGAVLDMLWSPFKTYNNEELKDMKTLMDSNISEYFKKIGYAFPTEVKPNVIPTTTDEWSQFNKDRQQYYTDNNLVSKSEVITEENVINTINKLNRFNNIFDKDPITGMYVPKSTSTVTQSKTLDTSNAMSLMLLAGLKAKSLGLTSVTKSREISTPQLATNSTLLKFVMANLIPIILLFLLLSSILSSIIGVLFI